MRRMCKPNIPVLGCSKSLLIDGHTLSEVPILPSQNEKETSAYGHQHQGKAICAADAEGHGLCSPCSIAFSSRCCTSTTDSSSQFGRPLCDGGSASGGRATWACGGHGTERGRVDAGGALSTTWIIIATRTLARRIALGTLVDAVGGCLGAFVVWDRLGVLGGVGGLSVAANAGVAQGAAIAVVGRGNTGGPWDLEAYEGAGGLLICAPLGCKEKSATILRGEV